MKGSSTDERARKYSCPTSAAWLLMNSTLFWTLVMKMKFAKLLNNTWGLQNNKELKSN
jgi:hypothetical protein